MQTRSQPYGYLKKFKEEIVAPAVLPVRRRGRPRSIITSKSRASEHVGVQNSTEEAFKNLGIPGKYLNLFKPGHLDLYGGALKKRRIGRRGNKCKANVKIHSKLD